MNATSKVLRRFEWRGVLGRYRYTEPRGLSAWHIITQGGSPMKFLDGWKTVLGVVGAASTVLIASGGDLSKVGHTVVQIGTNADAVVTGAFGLLAALGIVHKVQKSRGQ